MDDFDRAQELEMIQRDEAVARTRARFADAPGTSGAVPARGMSVKSAAEAARFDAMTALDCLECGKEIPEARRRALPGVMVCVKCQDFFERTGRMP